MHKCGLCVYMSAGMCVYLFVCMWVHILCVYVCFVFVIGMHMCVSVCTFDMYRCVPYAQLCAHMCVCI